MNLQENFRPNLACCARGQVGQGNIRVYSLKVCNNFQYPLRVNGR